MRRALAASIAWGWIVAPAGAAAPGPALAAVAVQAVAPAGAGRARVAECSGALIAPDLVLTAGHCLDGIADPSQVAVFVYDGDKPRPTPLRLAAFARHPDHVVGWRDRPGDPAERQREIAADLALLKLSAPAPEGAVFALAQDVAAASARPGAIAGTGGADTGARSGRQKAAALSAVRLSAGTDKTVGFATSAKTVCGGDSGGPAGSRSATGAMEIWGVVAAVIRGKAGCGARIVIAPVDAASEGFRRMQASVAAR